jgi:hypothetical protein
VSACQRNGSVNVDSATGTTRTWAFAGSRKLANAVVHPAGTPAVSAAGNGAGTSGTTAATASAATNRGALGHQARAASKPNANAAAAAPSEMIENLSGSTEPLIGNVCSQYQGSLIASCSWPPASKVPPREAAASTAKVSAAVRTGSSRQNRTVTMTSTTSNGQPTYARYSGAPP